MQPAPVGTRIKVIRNRHDHCYTVGTTYTVSLVDSDGTFKAADTSGHVGNWLRWEECEPLEPSAWGRIAAHLPEELVQFLSCFDGIGEIRLKESVIDAALARVPDLHERIVAYAATDAGAAMVAANRPPKPREPARS